MDIPNYVENETSQSPEQENYNQQLNLTLQQNLGQLGFVVTSITHADLTTTPILNPNTGAFTTVKDLAVDGAVWYVNNAVPPVLVVKANGALEKITTTPYP
jgi:hypothetical protein